MITKLGWKPLENRRAVSRLSLLYKSIHHTVAINTDEHLTSQADNKIRTRKSCEISFTHPTVKKDCYKHSFLPTMTEWNLLPPDIRQSTSVDSLKSKLNNMDLTSFIQGGPLLKSTPLAIKHACNSISRQRSLFAVPNRYRYRLMEALAASKEGPGRGVWVCHNDLRFKPEQRNVALQIHDGRFSCSEWSSRGFRITTMILDSKFTKKCCSSNPWWRLYFSCMLRRMWRRGSDLPNDLGLKTGTKQCQSSNPWWWL